MATIGVPNLCTCVEDGYCPRYGRDMSGRFRAICAGRDVDLGTAACFRAQWVREARDKYRPAQPSEPTPLILTYDQAPGDAVAMTAAVYSLHRAYPGEYRTSVRGPHPQIFWGNPDVVPEGSLPAGAPQCAMHYPVIHESNDRAVHFMQAWCEHLGDAMGVPLPLLTDRPHLHFAWPQPKRGRGWLICAGGKSDFTAKQWHGYQEVVDTLAGAVEFIQVGAAGDDHPRLRGAADMVGASNLRGLFELCRRARGVLCGTSLLMHVAAATETPAVVVAGGREPVAWNAYPRQHYLHTVGALPCRSTQGHVGCACWRSRTVPLGDGAPWDASPCERPQDGVPACMRMIRSELVAAHVMMVDDAANPL